MLQTHIWLWPHGVKLQAMMGSAAFFYVQAEEERQHMLKFIHYLNDMGVSASDSRN